MSLPHLSPCCYHGGWVWELSQRQLIISFVIGLPLPCIVNESGRCCDQATSRAWWGMHTNGPSDPIRHYRGPSHMDINSTTLQCDFCVLLCVDVSILKSGAMALPNRLTEVGHSLSDSFAPIIASHWIAGKMVGAASTWQVRSGLLDLPICVP
jgi:hypothetical protein